MYGIVFYKYSIDELKKKKNDWRKVEKKLNNFPHFHKFCETPRKPPDKYLFFSGGGALNTNLSAHTKIKKNVESKKVEPEIIRKK